MNATQIALVVFILLANYLVLVPALLSTSAVPHASSRHFLRGGTCRLGNQPFLYQALKGASHHE